MKSKEQPSKEKIREGLTALLKENFHSLGDYITFLENKMKRKAALSEREATKNLYVSHVKNDSYALIGIMKRTGYFTNEELKKFTRKYSDLGEKITVEEQKIKQFGRRVN